MALQLPKGGQLLKDGYKHLQGLEEAVLRNIDATQQLSSVTRTSLGPNGMNKMIVNHLEKLFVTNDAATIIKEMEVAHPAAKLLVMASQQQETEIGDGTNFVIAFAGELLSKAEQLLKLGLHTADVIEGYEVARAKVLEIVEELSSERVKDAHKPEELLKAVKSAIGSKQYGNEVFLAKLAVDACIRILPTNVKNFNIDNVRIVKILGGSIHDSVAISGMVFGREADGDVKKATRAKVAIFSCGLEIQQTETKGTVLLHNATELLDFSKGEEKQMEKCLAEIAASGVNVIVTGSGINDLALHFINRLGLMVVKVLSKFDLRRLARVVSATPLTRLGVPLPEEMGFCDVVETVEIGSDRCTVFRQEDEKTRTSTIVLRGSTSNTLDDLERAMDDAVNVVKAVCKDPRLLPGAGAVEIQLARQLSNFGEKTPGLIQHSIKAYAEAFEVIPRTLAQNAGLDSTEVVSQLYAGNGAALGVDIEAEDCLTAAVDAAQLGVFDVLSVKLSAIKLATDAAVTVLRVDQIIMSKPAGGPKAPKGGNTYDEDD